MNDSHNLGFTAPQTDEQNKTQFNIQPKNNFSLVSDGTNSVVSCPAEKKEVKDKVLEKRNKDKFNVSVFKGNEKEELYFEFPDGEKREYSEAPFRRIPTEEEKKETKKEKTKKGGFQKEILVISVLFGIVKLSDAQRNPEYYLNLIKDGLIKSKTFFGIIFKKLCELFMLTITAIQEDDRATLILIFLSLLCFIMFVKKLYQYIKI